MGSAGRSEATRESASAETDPATVNAALLRPVRPGNAFEDTVARLLQTIRLGVLAPGIACPERELSRPGSGSAATPCGRRSSRWPTPATWCRAAAATAAPSWPSCPRTQRRRGAGQRAELDDALRLREILEVGAARMAAGRTLSATERDGLRSRLADVRAAAPRTIGGWTRGCTWRSRRRRRRRPWCRCLPRTGCGSTPCSIRFRCCAATSRTPTISTDDRRRDPGR